ncbi:MAG: hypothetical protein SFV15_15635 [Polyangiaceae bacterium]|nr:hypothetical protein [Polyangiaceae bacterium]
MSSGPKYQEILIRLADAEVESIVVGMAAAVIQGVPTMTWDLDIVHRRTQDNVDRLLGVLADIDAFARNDKRRLRPNATHLMGPGHILLETRFGDFDCLGSIDGARTYEDLLSATLVVEVDRRKVRVLALRELLGVKTRAGRPKDIAAIPYLQSTLAEIEGKRE